MEIAIISFCIIVVSIIIVVIMSRRRNEKTEVLTKKTGIVLDNDDSNEISLVYENILSLDKEDENRLSEISDEKMISKIDQILPGTAQIISNSVSNVGVNNDGQLYRVIIPKHTKLVRSRNTEGAYRGFVRDKKGIKAQAELVPSNNSGAKIANTVSSVMSVASLVVGQYYMHEINGKLDAIAGEIDKVNSFLNNEYKSKVLALLAGTKKSSDFQLEIMENDSLRKSNLICINDLETNCIQLLGQANITIDEYAQKEIRSYKEYEKDVAIVDEWVLFQHTLLEVLNRLCELTYVFYLGESSYEQCFFNYFEYCKQTESASIKLTEWHDKNAERFKLDLESGKRKRQGIGGALIKIPALFNDELEYKEIAGKTVKMISDQRNASEIDDSKNEINLFDENVELIIKDGKVYYLPPEH